MMVSIVVVLPAPLRPTSTTDSPAPTRKETPRSTWTGPRKVSIRSTSSMPGTPVRRRTGGVGSDERGCNRVVAAELIRRSVRGYRVLVHDDLALRMEGGG